MKQIKVDAPTKEKIVELVNENPRISVLELAEKLNIKSSSNVHYHIRRLMKAGRIHWLGKVKMRGKNLPSAMAKRWEKGLVKLPRHTREEEAALIEKVVQKAQGSGKNGEEDPGDDVVRFTKGYLFKNWRLRGCRY
jgi:predicted ArsR family transcriptional regulator